jgi:type I restriction enzyme S subunit
VSWPTVKLGDVFEIARGGSPRPIDDYLTDDDDGLNWISIKDASDSDKFISKTKKRIKPSGLSKTRTVKPGDFLLTNSMSFGRPYIMNTSGCIHDGWLVLSGDLTKINQDYFYHLLGSDFMFKKFSSLAAGAVVKNLNSDLVRNIEVKLPPLPEQKRIAAILDKADSIRLKRQQAIKLADEFLRAVFLEMFGDPVTNPKGFPIKKLSEFTKITTGNTPSRSVPKYYGDYIEWIKSDNINTPSHFLTKATEYLSIEGCSISRTVPAGSTLVTCIAGSFECIGNAAYTDREVAFNQQINALTPKQGISSWFLYALVLMSKKSFQAASTNAMKGMLSKGRMGEIELILPCLELQKKFEEHFIKYIRLSDLLSKTVNRSEMLFRSLSTNAFLGKP